MSIRLYSETLNKNLIFPKYKITLFFNLFFLLTLQISKFEKVKYLQRRQGLLVSLPMLVSIPHNSE